MSKKPKTQVVQGRPEQIAAGIFQNMIVPMHSQMASVSDQDADEFAFCIAGTAVAGFLSSADDLESAYEMLTTYIECMYKDIQNEKKGAGILAKPMGTA